VMSAYLRCIAAHCPSGSSERVTMARVVLDEACQSGQLSRLVIQALKEALAGSTDEQIVRDIQTKGNRPEAWIRNVPASFR